jgi:phosphopantetheine--protein transferase-like protein
MHIKNLGIDAVEIERFKQWHLYRRKTLLRVFTAQELEYICVVPEKSPERFATRFAVKEAVFKSISSCIADSFFTVARHIEVVKQETGDIACRVDWEQMQCKTTMDDVRNVIIAVSVTHTRTTAIAVVLLQ